MTLIQASHLCGKETKGVPEAYGIRGNLYQWIKSFLCYKKMRVVVEGHNSSDVHVASLTFGRIKTHAPC
jgi:hypothetical protein